MNKDSKIYVPGNTGLVGSAIVRKLKEEGYTNLVFTPYPEYDLTNQGQVSEFLSREKPEYVIIAAAKVGGIIANNTYRAQFIYENLMIESNLIHQSFVNGVKKLLFLGSSCIYPKECPQPIKEEYLLTGLLEQTNEPYAIAKIAGIKLCESYYRQYGCNFISVMPTNLYGPQDNYNLETSHVLPALIRKMHLGHCLEKNDWPAIRADLNKRPIRDVDGDSEEKEILRVLREYGIEITNYELRITNYELGITNYELGIRNYESGIRNYESGIRNYESGIRNMAENKVTVRLWGSGKVYREFLHVDDMTSACYFLMQNLDASMLYDDLKITHINIGTGEDLTIRELAGMVKGIVGFKGEILWDSSKPDGTYKKLLDVSRLKSLGWAETIKLKEGIAAVYLDYIK